MPNGTVQRMAKGAGGRPPKDEGDRGTRHIRVFEDLAEMIGWIVEVDRLDGGRTTSAQLCDPMLRAGIVARFKLIEKRVEAIKKAQQAKG